MSKTRLICPNCGAQYEVPLDVIPDTGRDVQCSNCSHTWFQVHPGYDVAGAADLNTALPDDDWSPEDMDGPDEPSEPAPAPRKRQLDPAVADVLRQEAELEAQRRAADVNALEDQPDLGLSAPMADEQALRARQARDRMARIRGNESEETEADPAQPNDAQSQDAPATDGQAAAQATAAAAGSRKEVLPNVDEINQSLRSSERARTVAKTDDTQYAKDRPGSGFARGFFLIVLLVLIAIAIYVSVPQIKAQIPTAAPYLDGYVTWVDGLRSWLDEQVVALMAKLDSMSSEAALPETGSSDAGN